MNQIVNKFLWTEDKSMLEMHVRKLPALDKSGFTYSACEPSRKSKERIQKIKKIRRFKETEDSWYTLGHEWGPVDTTKSLKFDFKYNLGMVMGL